MTRPLLLLNSMLHLMQLTSLIAPERPIPKPEPEKPPEIWETNWGTLTWKGRTISIDGHAKWFGNGHIRDDGRVYVLWIERDTSRPAPAVYEVKGTALIGLWGYEDNVRVDISGNLVGATMHDRTFKLADRAAD